MSTRPFSELRKDIDADPVRRLRVETMKNAMLKAVKLAELRRQLGMTQQELAKDLGQSQANVSRIEHEEDLYLSTLDEYITAMGGKLKLTAMFDEVEIPLVIGN